MTTALSYPYGEALISGVLKQQAEDFRVVENLGFQPCGEGEHLFLNIEKTNLTTSELIQCVALDFGMQARDIGYSGLKDKHAVTRQWLSLYLPGKMHSLEMPKIASYRLVDYSWHNKKIRPGSHRSNSFNVKLRQVDSFPPATHKQIDLIEQQGFANYFGQQRFGQQQDNVTQALRTFGNARKARKLSRSKRSIYLSSLRSFLFNQILHQRILQGHWNQPLEGDVFMLHGSRSIFTDVINEIILERYKNHDISSAACLYGTGQRRAGGEALALEDGVIGQFADIAECLIAQKVNLQMRSTRAQASDFVIDYDAGENLLGIKVTLPRGCYLTTLLAHFVAVI